jgi:hypothetical protein
MSNPILGWKLILAERIDTASEQRTASTKTELKEESHGEIPISSNTGAFQRARSIVSAFTLSDRISTSSVLIRCHAPTILHFNPNARASRLTENVNSQNVRSIATLFRIEY